MGAAVVVAAGCSCGSGNGQLPRLLSQTAAAHWAAAQLLLSDTVVATAVRVPNSEIVTAAVELRSNAPKETPTIAAIFVLVASFKLTTFPCKQLIRNLSCVSQLHTVFCCVPSTSFPGFK